MLNELCNDPDVSVIAIQEHWLSEDKLYKLNNVHDDFCAYGISAMKTAYCKDIYEGRPFGGVGFLWRNKLANNIKIIDKDINGRCLAISLNNGNGRCINMISVYFPCFVENKKYYSELTQCLGS